MTVTLHRCWCRDFMFHTRDETLILLDFQAFGAVCLADTPIGKFRSLGVFVLLTRKNISYLTIRVIDLCT
jgi:hypothetical protein